MKLYEIYEPEQLDEVSLKQLATAGIAAGSLAGMINTSHQPHTTRPPAPVVHQTQQAAPPKIEEPQIEPEQHNHSQLAQQISAEYRIDPKLAFDIVNIAHKYEKDTFPTARDILAVIGVESSFNPSAKSKLRHDPARGLMQVRPRIWGLTPSDLHTIEDQVRVGAEILHRYFVKLKSKEAALNAYNVGITNYRHGKKNPRYVAKVKNELQKYDDEG